MSLKKYSVVLASLLLIMGVSGCVKNDTKKEIVNYLEDKYNEEFVVESYEKKSKLEYEYGGDKITAHPKNNNEIVFVAGQANTKDGGYYDTYYLSMVGDKITSDIKEEVDGIIDNKDEYKIAIYGLNNSFDLNNEVSAKDFIKNNNVNVVLNVAIRIDGNEDMDKVFEKSFKLLNLLESLGSSRYKLSVGIVSGETKISEHIRTANANNVSWKDLDEDVKGSIIISHNEKVNSINEISNYYIGF